MKANPATQPLAVAYLIGGLAALLAIGFSMQRSEPLAAFAPALIGVGGLIFHWRWAPLGVLAALAGGLVLAPRSAPLAQHLLLCGSVVFYLLSQYRLTSLRAGILPAEADSGDEPVSRNSDADPTREFGTALMTAAAAAVTAFFLWEITALVRPRWNLQSVDWRLELLVWFAAIVVIGAMSVIGYLSWRRQSGDEALLYLRDEFWRQTRGEQRKINRWLAWGRRRAERAGRTTNS